jgi:hypothetical protein
MRRLHALAAVALLALPALGNPIMGIPTGGGGCTETWYEEGFDGSGEISGISGWARIRTQDNIITQTSSQASYTKVGSGFQSAHTYAYTPTGSCDEGVAFSVQWVDASGTILMGARVDGNNDGYRINSGSPPEWRTYSFDDGAANTLVDNSCNESFTEAIAANDYVGVTITGTGASTVVVYYDFDATVPSNDAANWPSQAAAGGTCTLDADPGTAYDTHGKFVLGLGGNSGSPFQLDSYEAGDD